MLPDRVSNPGPLTLRVRCPTDCATRPGLTKWILLSDRMVNSAYPPDILILAQIVRTPDQFRLPWGSLNWSGVRTVSARNSAPIFRLNTVNTQPDPTYKRNISLPSSLGDDHLSSQGAKLGPQVPVLQGYLEVLVHPLASGPAQHPLMVTVARK